MRGFGGKEKVLLLARTEGHQLADETGMEDDRMRTDGHATVDTNTHTRTQANTHTGS